MPISIHNMEYFASSIISLCVLVLLLSDRSNSCGPGRSSGYRRGPRKMTPLVFKQHVPNVSENTIGASGLAEGQITRSDPKLKDLVSNYNPDIVFKDEEGTGADRIMTQRCKDKLNTLAISVMNQWKDVKLRVTEGWDEDGHHATESLHYEGRAIDITTSDRDRAKYGMLARLAVEAGFDWVYFESRGHIHCSVKSDSSIAIKTGGCFSGDDTVQLETGGTTTLADVRLGDRVLAVDKQGTLVYDEIIAFIHRDHAQQAIFYELRTDDGQRLTVTADHLVYSTGGSSGSSGNQLAYSTGASSCGNQFVHSTGGSPKNQLIHSTDDSSGENQLITNEPVFASEVRVGDYLYASAPYRHLNLSAASLQLRKVRVVSINAVVHQGIYAPLTASGTLVVSGLATSCYATFASQSLAHASMMPLRFAARYIRDVIWSRDDNMVDTFGDGVHWYASALENTARYFLADDLWFKT